MRLDSLGAFKAKSQGTETTDIANSAVDNANLALNAYAVDSTTEANLIQSESFTIHGILNFVIFNISRRDVDDHHNRQNFIDNLVH